MRRRIAAVLILAFVVQSLLRLALLAPFHGLGRLSPFVHGAALIVATGFFTGAFLAARGRKFWQLVVAIILASICLVLTVYDIGAFVAGWIGTRPLPLDTAAEFYCEGKRWLACFPHYPRLSALVAAIWAALACVLFACADEIADHLEPAAIQAAKAARRRLRLGPRPVLGLMGASYVLAWLAAPAFMAAREPSVNLLAPVAFTDGPEELVNLERPKYRVQPSPVVRPRMLVLITVDSLRNDAIVLEPGKPTLTPFLRELAKSGRLRNLGAIEAICASSYCGITSLLSSGTWGSQQRGPPLMLPDVLAANGYQSHFVLSGAHRTAYNLGKLYGPNVTTLLDDLSPDSSMLADDRELIVRLASLRISIPERSFLSIHMMSAHILGRRYYDKNGAKPKSLAERLRSVENRSDYADGVRQADDTIRQLFAVMERRRFLENALVLITSDHGERIGGSGLSIHGGEPDADTVPIPLLVYESNPSAWPTHKLISQADIAPTLLDAIGIPKPEGWTGYSLLRPDRRRAAATDGSVIAGMVGIFDGRKLLLRCNTTTGETDVVAFSDASVAGGEVAKALAQAPALYAELPRRLDGSRCFTPPAPPASRSAH